MPLFLLCFFLFVNTYAQENSVTINVQTKDLPAGSKVFITGNNRQMGSWNPGLIELDSIAENIRSKKFLFSKGENIEFKITRGDWQNEAIYKVGETPANFRLKVEKDTAISIFIEHWKDQFEQIIVGQITGNVEYVKDLEGEGILPRDIIIWLPPGYDSNLNHYYPVLYMHDGQNLFDPRTASFGVDWQLDETADSLIRNEIIEEIIIVGIYNSSERRSDYSPGSKGYAYMNFIVNKLKPFIDEKYRTLPDRENTAVGGSSMGGLISFMLLWEHNDVFAKAACFSPAFKYIGLDYVSFVDSTASDKRSFSLYLDNGDVGLEEQLQSGIDDMMEVLKKHGYEFEWFIDKNAEHNEAAWAKRAWRPLIQFFRKE